MKYYVVWSGRAPGVYRSWEECREAVEGVPGARYKAFPTQEAAVEAFRGDPAEAAAIIRAIGARPAHKVNYAAIPELVTDALAVDAACSKNPGPVEYRGVDVLSGAELFHAGPFPMGTNNIGEFLAIVHGLAYLKQRGLHTMPIYSDSLTARAWVRNRAVKTTITPTAANALVRQLLERALYWLSTNTWTNPILVWNTKEWGEIPADFGRK